MNTIGIDMSKDSFHAAFDEKEVKVFKNTSEGIKYFIRSIIEHDYSKESVIIGTEATGVYHLLLCEKLRSAGWKIKVINPLITNRMFKSDLRHAKTDKHDAVDSHAETHGRDARATTLQATGCAPILSGEQPAFDYSWPIQ